MAKDNGVSACLLSCSYIRDPRIDGLLDNSEFSCKGFFSPLAFPPASPEGEADGGKA